ncbi:MAG: alpha/beta fold hydrolase [Geitlerinemataceae cyanobacterium]
MKIEEKFVEVGALTWFYREVNPANSSPRLPVLFLHGIPSQSYSWSAILPQLSSKGFRAIAPDWIGSGRSSQPDKREFNYTSDTFIRALDDFLTALKIDKFHLVVQGFLGSVGLQYALRNPDRIERLAILNTPISGDAKLPWKIQQMGLPLVGDMMTQDPLLVDRTLEAGSGFVVTDEDLDVYRRPFLRSSDAGRSLLMTIRNLDLKAAMAELEAGWEKWQHPTLLIWGTLDPWLAIEPAQTLADRLENGKLIRLEKAGHYPQDHWPQEISDALLRFFHRQDD